METIFKNLQFQNRKKPVHEFGRDLRRDPVGNIKREIITPTSVEIEEVTDIVLYN